MSQLALQGNGEGPSDTQFRHSPSSPASTFQGSPTIGRTQTQNAASSLTALPVSPDTADLTGSSHSDSNSLPSQKTTFSFSSRPHRKAAPSPLQTNITLSSATYEFPSPPRSSQPLVPQIVTTSPEASPPLPSKAFGRQKPYHLSNISSPSTPEARTFVGLPSSPRYPNESCRSASDPVVASTRFEGSSARPSPAMAGPRVEAAKGAPRNSSMDSAISAISASSHTNKNGGESPGGAPDVANLIKTAGSAEAVIQYLLKEKTSQAQQNAQLWRLVDKQRAMILGLNKDLERALKDKEKYRKKLKEVTSAADMPPLPAVTASSSRSSGTNSAEPRSANNIPILQVPSSPVLGSGSQKESPVDVSLAPYPITPPADQPEPPSSAVAEILNPSHSMPVPQEHALDQFDHEAEEREAEEARKEAAKANEIPLNLGLPPSRSLPSEPPRMPPPRPPVSTAVDDSLGQFPRPPAPPAPPPRKPPPAPLQLRDTLNSPTIPREEELEPETDDSDFDELLEVTDIADAEKRGRRRTREEDEHEREIIALKEAESRSQSKKSAKSNGKGTPRVVEPESTLDIPASPRSFPAGVQQQHSSTASLASVLSGNDRLVEVSVLAPPLRSPGLPASPRPFGLPVSPLQSPPLSPRGAPRAAASGPLSPRSQRPPIPLPPNTPQHTPPTGNVEALDLKTPKPLNIVKKAMDALSGSTSPTKTTRDSPVERSKVYKGFATEEYPDLLLPPNALPSVDIKVASSRMKPSRASLLSLTQLEEDPVFTLAIFSRADGGELWRVEKDTTSLAKLDQKLKHCAAFTARTPDRSLFSGHAPAKLDARRLALDQYLDELLNTPLDTATALELCRYLSTNTLPPNADETGSVVASSAESTVSQKTGPGGRPFKSGYLTKRGKNFGGWKARFFVLEGPHLRYYETPGGAHLGTIKLPSAQIGKQSQSQNSDNASPARGPGGEEMDNQYRHAFLILEPKKKDPSTMTKHVLCAESDVERDQWVDTLLRWIDYRDHDEDESKKDKEQGGSERTNASANNKKKKAAAGPSAASKQPHPANPHTQHPTDSSDTLIGVNYEATQQGETPHAIAPKAKSGSGHEQDMMMPTMSSQPAYAISGPRDAHVISDSASWGNKPSGLAAPEEKKARKRSFFGFTKTRTSSDGNDSLFGGDGGGTASAAGPHPTYNMPVRQVFGVPLAEAVRYNSPTDVRVPLPAVVYRCIQYLEAKNAIHEEGIFRLSGSNLVIKQLRERFNTEGDIDLIADENYHDIHAVTSLLKSYLRELPTTILTRDLHMEFLAVTEIPNAAAKIAGLGELVQRLPLANATLLRYLIAFLVKIINNADTNKMTVRNVGIVFSPTLNIPAPVFAMFLQNYVGIFGVDPEEYELPSPSSMEMQGGHGGNYGHGYAQPRPDDAGSETGSTRNANRRPSMSSVDYQVRPGTSGTGGSPHRARLADTMQHRSSPTPPLMGPPGTAGAGMVNPHQGGGNNNGRSGSTPTPPPSLQQAQLQQLQQQQQQYLAQMQAGGRPAYDSGFNVPQGFDLSQLRTPTGGIRMPNPGYDQPIYEGSTPASRRESAILMGPGALGGLSHQGSRSRLREETHY